jgi:glutathione synthase/RimK-type ligase-like ATP-grasp enzyme
LILALTSRGDLTTDYVIAALNEAGAVVTRLNTNDLLNDWCFCLTPDGQSFRSGDRMIRPDDVTAVYYRRTYAPQPPPSVDRRGRLFAAREGRIVLRALYAALTCPWISHHAAIAAAENKPRQLAAARRLGLRVPDTIVTNDPHIAKAFFAKHTVVATKALSYGDLGEGKVLHTSIVQGWQDAFADAIASAPTLLQQYIEKQADYRVTVVDDQVFACRIDSQRAAISSVDMRRGLSDLSMSHDLVTLPADIAHLCVDIVKEMHLRFGAIDLVLDLDGQFWFLEVNPNGQWAWIQQRTGARIANAIAEGLMQHGR